MTSVGIIGVGYLGECLAEGLSKAGIPLVLSPRGKDRVARLAAAYGCEVAPDNASVVEKCDLVLLATRPGDIVSTAADLPWREGQRAVSVAAGIGLGAIKDAVAPAMAFRSMPLAASRIQASPTGFCPADATVQELFEATGTAHPFKEEEQFETASIFGAYYALIYAFIDEAAGWAQTNGLDAVDARKLTARMVQGAASAVIDGCDRPPRELLNDLLTPGGITEAGLEVLEDHEALSRWSQALDASLRRAKEIGGS